MAHCINQLVNFVWHPATFFGARRLCEEEKETNEQQECGAGAHLGEAIKNISLNNHGLLPDQQRYWDVNSAVTLTIVEDIGVFRGWLGGGAVRFARRIGQFSPIMGCVSYHNPVRFLAQVCVAHLVAYLETVAKGRICPAVFY
ncbi:hypothetical protein [Aliiroseovarius lamellibrachiae]|uniref:hypothetical protein n=1 Tax=Aliiroseovarius lamellibrachiae TaxID=1924933 RepID=UPI001BE079B3|nr:hypothetical protein [Aliiroseovarius lamellibrachiae]MBT2130816.1 hypothetical protein [Aliiroseovarius lamellibrachiae]